MSAEDGRRHIFEVATGIEKNPRNGPHDAGLVVSDHRHGNKIVTRHRGDSTLDGVTPEPAQESKGAPASWTRLDWLMVSLIGLGAGILRGVGVSAPSGLVFDEFYYGPDACRYVRESADLCGFGELTYFHPPLSKWLMSLGIQIFGPIPLGYRAPAVFFGMLTVIVVYVLGRRLLRSTAGASIAASLVAIDFLHFLHSRIAMLDVYVTFFGTLTVLFAVMDHDDGRAGFYRPWRLAAGLAGGAAIACKWSGLTMLLVAIAIDDRHRQVTGQTRSLSDRVLHRHIDLRVADPDTAPDLRVQLHRPAAGRSPRSALGGGSVAEGIRTPTGRQRRLSGSSERAHPGSRSPVFVPGVDVAPPQAAPVLLLRRLFERHVRGDPCFRKPAGLVELDPGPHVLGLALRSAGASQLRCRHHRGRVPSPFLPWFALSLGGPDPYIFYLLPAIPFMCLALGYVGARAWERRAGRIASLVFVAATLALFGFFYPVLTAKPLTPDQWHARMLFRYCRYEKSTTLGQQLRRAGLPIKEAERIRLLPPRAIIPNQSRATGWCWI